MTKLQTSLQKLPLCRQHHLYFFNFMNKRNSEACKRESSTAVSVGLSLTLVCFVLPVRQSGKR